MTEVERTPSYALLTDLYELTMSYGYWKLKLAETEGVFHLTYRKLPFGGGYAIAAGLDTALEMIENLRFSKEDLAYLATLKGSDERPLFEKDFLDYLSNLKIQCDIDAIAEGEVVFPQEPILRVKGPLLHVQLLETILLNIINFQTLIATKASRIAWAASPDPVIEFGLRRAQGIDGGLSASRAAFIGGVNATSNVLAGKKWNIPVKGTQSHSWVMAFEEEEEAFYSFGKMLPGNCIFLVDTFETLRGVKRALKAAKKLKKDAIEMLGIRLDSGDLADLSIKVRQILDREGFKEVKILASNELDENIIQDLKLQKAKIDIWCVGTSVVTGKGQAALDGVYKLSALKDKEGKWCYKVKLSEQTAKVSLPGILQVRRFIKEGGCVGDVIYDEMMAPKGDYSCIDSSDLISSTTFSCGLESYDLLQPVMRRGKRLEKSPSLQQLQARCQKALFSFPVTMRRFLNPHPYYVGIEDQLFKTKMSLIEKLRKEE